MTGSSSGGRDKAPKVEKPPKVKGPVHTYFSDSDKDEPEPPKVKGAVHTYFPDSD